MNHHRATISPALKAGLKTVNTAALTIMLIIVFGCNKNENGRLRSISHIICKAMCELVPPTIYNTFDNKETMIIKLYTKNIGNSPGSLGLFSFSMPHEKCGVDKDVDQAYYYTDESEYRLFHKYTIRSRPYKSDTEMCRFNIDCKNGYDEDGKEGYSVTFSRETCQDQCGEAVRAAALQEENQIHLHYLMYRLSPSILANDNDKKKNYRQERD